jgi:hypothetical protein
MQWVVKCPIALGSSAFSMERDGEVFSLLNLEILLPTSD